MAEENPFDSLNLERNKAPLGELLKTGQTEEQPAPAAPAPQQTVEAPAAEPAVPAEAVVEEGATGQEVPVAPSPELAAEEQEPMGFGEAFGHAYKYETLTGYGARMIQAPDFNPDPDFHPNMGYYDDNFKDIPREFHDMLYEAESQEELDYKAQWLRERINDQERFDSMGTGSQIGVLLGATVLDAPALAVSALAGLVTGGAGTTVAAGRLGVTGTRVVRVLGAAAGVGAEAAIQEAILSTADPLKNEKTVMLAGLVGFGFGAAGSTVGQALAKSQIAKAAQKDAERLTDNLITTTAEEIGVTAKPADVLQSTTVNTPVDDLYNIEAGQKEVLHNLGIDITSQLKRSNDPEFQRLGAIMGEDGIYGGNSTMALEFDTISRPVLADGMKAVNESYNAWAKENGVTLVGRIAHKNRLDFNRNVADVVRGVSQGATPAEQKAAAGVQKFFNDMLNVAKNSGVKGFENIPDNINYLTRVYSDVNFRKAVMTHGKDMVVKTIKGAIMSAQGNELDDVIAEKIALGIYNRTTQQALLKENKFTTVLTNDFKQEMSDILEASGMELDEIQKVLTKLEGDGTGSQMNVTKHRINMNEAYVDGQTGLKFTDLLENNIESLMVRYNRNVGGAAAAARFGFENPRKLIDHIHKTADEAFSSGKMTKREAMDKRNIALNLANQLLGYPNETHGDFQRIAQALMDYEFIRTSGGFALASLPEMLITTAQNGFRATLSHVPMARKFIDDARKGIAPDQEIMNVLESWGVGRDVDLMNSFVRVAEDDALNDTFNKGIQLLNTGKRVAAMASGLPQLTRFSQLLAGKSTIQKFTDMAYKGKPAELSKWLNQLGYKEQEQLDNVMAGLKKYVKTEKGVLTGRKVTALDFDGWYDEDPQAATRFMHSVARAVNHQIQRNLQGELPAFMSKTWAKLLTQFQTFGIAAYSKKTLNAIARRDMESAVAIGLTTAAAGMIYSARIYALSLTRDDPQKFREEMLSPTNIVKASIQRSGYASILPNMIDNGIALTKPFHGQDRIFNDYARTSGLTTGGLESIPAAQTAKNIIDAGAIPRKMITGEEVQEKDIRALTNISPLRRLPAINYTYESLINSFPERGEEK